MFLSSYKNYFLRKKIEKSFLKAPSFFLNKNIETLGILIDESHYNAVPKLLEIALKNKIHKNNIKFLVFVEKKRGSELIIYPSFSLKEINLNGDFDNQEVQDFINKKWDVLINYYDQEKKPLVWVSQLCNANFKVGFASIDSRVNQIMINTDADNCEVFAEELFKYLKIVNKK